MQITILETILGVTVSIFDWDITSERGRGRGREREGEGGREREGGRKRDGREEGEKEHIMKLKGKQKSWFWAYAPIIITKI